MTAVTGFIDALAKLIAGAIDSARYRYWLQFQNGNAELLAAHEAIDDAFDCVESVARAINDGDTDEALRLCRMSMERLEEHTETLRGLL